MISKKRRYLLFLEAAIITLLVYSSAILVNDHLDEMRTDSLNYEFANSTLAFQGMLTSSDFLSAFNQSNSCEVEKDYIFRLFPQLKDIGTDLSNFGKLYLRQNENFSLTKQREYFLQQLSLYRTVLEHNKNCEDNIVPVLYFFDSTDPSLDKQSLILEQFSLNHRNKTIVFSFDINYNKEPLLEYLKDKYNVSSAPFIVIGNKTTRDLKNNNGLVSLNTVTLEYKRIRGEI